MVQVDLVAVVRLRRLREPTERQILVEALEAGVQPEALVVPVL
jgi:hypothetical protein